MEGSCARYLHTRLIDCLDIAGADAERKDYMSFRENAFDARDAIEDARSMS
jgi:hypothetical protein